MQVVVVGEIQVVSFDCGTLLPKFHRDQRMPGLVGHYAGVAPAIWCHNVTRLRSEILRKTATTLTYILSNKHTEDKNAVLWHEI